MTSLGSLPKTLLTSLDSSEKSSNAFPLHSTQTTESLSPHSSSAFQRFNLLHSLRLQREKELSAALATAEFLDSQLATVASPRSATSLAQELTDSRAQMLSLQRECEVMSAVYLRTRRELERKKAAVANLREMIDKFSQKVTALRDEMTAAQRVVTDFRYEVSQQSRQFTDVTDKHRQSVEIRTESLTSSIHSLGRRWREQRIAENVRNKRLARIQNLHSRLHAQKRTRMRLLMQVGVQEIAKFKLEKRMKELCRVFGTTTPVEVIEKLEFERVRGDLLQQNADFLITRVSSLRRTFVLLRMELDNLLNVSRLSSSAVSQANSAIVRNIETQLTAQEQIVSDLAILVANIEAVLRMLLRKYVESDQFALLCCLTEDLKALGLAKLLLLFEKVVGSGLEIAEQKRFFWEKRQKTALTSKLLANNAPSKRPSLLLPAIPSILSPSVPKSLQRRGAILPVESKVTDDFAEIRARQEEYKKQKTSGSFHSLPRSGKAVRSEREKSRKLQEVFPERQLGGDFVKQLRMVDEARRQISAISRQQSWKNSDKRASCSLWAFATVPSRSSL